MSNYVADFSSATAAVIEPTPTPCASSRARVAVFRVLRVLSDQKIAVPHGNEMDQKLRRQPAFFAGVAFFPVRERILLLTKYASSAYCLSLLLMVRNMRNSGAENAGLSR